MKAMWTLSVGLLAALALATPSAPAVAGPAGKASARMIDSFNELREREGLRPLRVAPRLRRSARGFARHLGRTASFRHGTAHTRAGFRRTGEIIAVRNGRRFAVRPALGQWLRSPGHRALILDQGFRYVGAAPARSSLGGAPAVLWVAHFGAH